jgi:hypothetical protein
MATTTPNYGWDVPTSTDYVKDGATAIETLGDDIDATLYTALGGAYPGLRLVKKQTIGTGVSSVTVTGAFSATYDNYKIIVSGGVGSAATGLGLKLGATTTGYYMGLLAVTYSNAGNDFASVNNGASFSFAGRASTDSLWANLELNAPFLSKNTFISAPVQNAATGGSAGATAGYLNNTTSYTDFTFTPATGTLTGGTIYVYGYGAS